MGLWNNPSRELGSILSPYISETTKGVFHGSFQWVTFYIVIYIYLEPK